MVDKNFPVRAERSDRAVGGISMGGFGAIKLGLKHPDTFASVDSLSGLPALARRPEEAQALSPEFTRIFGDSPTDGPEDPFPLAAAVKPRKCPALRIVCGDDDPFLPQNREFHRQLESVGYSMSTRSTLAPTPGASGTSTSAGRSSSTGRLWGSPRTPSTRSCANLARAGSRIR